MADNYKSIYSDESSIYNKSNDSDSDNYYFRKYMEYKTKYMDLNNSYPKPPDNENGDTKIIMSIGGKSAGNRYDCDPTKPFLEICNEKEDGKYKSQQSCINDCEVKYINRNLIEAKLKYETKQFQLLIEDLFNEHITIYIKGGTVLGLKILKMVYNRYGESTDFEKYFNRFLELDLIRDWDFASYTYDVEIDKTFRDKTDEMARKLGLVPRAKTFILYQARRPIQLDEQALFEIAILQSDDLSGLELPLTTMKVKINRRNLNYVFMFAKCFYSYKTKNVPIDLDVVKYMIKDMNILIYPHKDGLFETTPETFDTGGLSKDLLTFIGNFAKKNRDLEQFLITEIMEPHRLFYRLLEKNIPKVEKISKFLIEVGIAKKDKLPTWLFDPKYIMKTVTLFVDELGKKMVEVYEDDSKKINQARMVVISDQNNNNMFSDLSNSDSSDLSNLSEYSDMLVSNLSSDSINSLGRLNGMEAYEIEMIQMEHSDKYIAAIELAVKNVAEFIGGINLDRVRIEYDKFAESGRDLVKKMFYPLYKQIIKNNNDNSVNSVNKKNILSELSNDIKLIQIIKFLEEKKLFD
ncbi:MAG: hypothetical protein Terrestrivirus3_205 [Terrestrivirus sp.]|uniref:Uncharacterized protein n=1 Tax=Terrestrivirus sp. TaxID=2487775 RepID=A0A3G4ZM65_9VIRU|nr:MAG: hypothetical protein Terrestrivirus3_205 [Terrestrivirus sp.]